MPTRLQEELVKYFVGGTTARSAALLTGVNRHTATLFFRKLREVIAQRLDKEAPELLGGEVEIDESYFGGRRKGKRGRGAGGKVPVFGLLKRGGKVHTVIIPNVGSKTLFPIIQARIKPDAVVYSDSFQAYDVLDVSEFRHMRINHRGAFRRQGKSHQRHRELLEPGQTPSAPLQWHPKSAVLCYLKECEWRFNYRPADRLLATLNAWLNEFHCRPIWASPFFYSNRS